MKVTAFVFLAACGLPTSVLIAQKDSAPEKPQLFLPGIVSIPDTREFSCTMSPDGEEFYFSRMVSGKYTILMTRKTDDGWSEPEPASFAGEHFNHEPYITHDGRKIYWGTIRPHPDGSKEEYAVWVADRDGANWINARPLPFHAMYVTSTTDGILYYTGKGPGGAVIARAQQAENGEWKTETLPEPLLAEEWDGHPLIAPDESWLIFDSETRPGTDECGLFISIHKKDGSWSKPRNMVETLGMGRFAMLSPDGKFLYFSWKGDIYRVSSTVIEHYQK
jgi:hypothetical protein